MADQFQEVLQNPDDFQVSDQEIIKEIEAENEKDYLRQLKKKNEGYLVEGLSAEEKQRVANWICDRHEESIGNHNELCDRIDEYDDVYRMTRKTIEGDDGELPDYRTPLSAVAMEVVHANIMNVFFTPKDIMRPLPTEEGDIPKVKKLGIFGNWSIKNELKIFEQTDRLFHNSNKVGECPYIVHWEKRYGTEIKREVLKNPADPTQPLYDPDTQEPIFQEFEEEKLLYNGPVLDVMSRKDYIQPKNAMMDKPTDWDMRKVRKSYDEYLREELQGKMFKGSGKLIKGWQGSGEDTNKEDSEGDTIPMGSWTKEFIEFYGRIRLKVIKQDKEKETH